MREGRAGRHRHRRKVLKEHVMRAAVVRKFGAPLVIEQRPVPR